MTYTEQFEEVYEELQKAIRDRSHLTQKVITDKNGHTRKVWVNPLDKEQMKKRKVDKVVDETPQEKWLSTFKDRTYEEIKKIKSEKDPAKKEKYKEFLLTEMMHYQGAIYRFANWENVNDGLPSSYNFDYTKASYDTLFGFVKKLDREAERQKKIKRAALSLKKTENQVSKPVENKAPEKDAETMKKDKEINTVLNTDLKELDRLGKNSNHIYRFQMRFENGGQVEIGPGYLEYYGIPNEPDKFIHFEEGTYKTFMDVLSHVMSLEYWGEEKGSWYFTNRHNGQTRIIKWIDIRQTH